MLPSPHPLLDATLRAAARRYRVPAVSQLSAHDAGAAAALAVSIEHARRALAAGETPPPALRHAFLAALARLIREALREPGGDPVFQALLLRHRNASVREYAALSAGAARDRRDLVAAANTLAHPAKLERMPAAPPRAALARLHAAAIAQSWAELARAADELLGLPGACDPAVLQRLLAGPALRRLQRLDALASDAEVRRYRERWLSQGPTPGSADAAAQGDASRERGAAVEALAVRAMQALARALNAAADGAPYLAVSSMRVPPSIPASAERAKSEWDAALLRRAGGGDAAPTWDVCLLLEAKASADAAATDFPRLLRGLRLLAHADAQTDYLFRAREGGYALRGGSLRALPTEGPALERAVLYFSDAPADARPRLLSAASRMQLLGADASLDYAGRLTQGEDAPAAMLEPVWTLLLESPQWAGVLQQYPMLRQARELMVHADDLMAAIAASQSGHRAAP